MSRSGFALWIAGLITAFSEAGFAVGITLVPSPPAPLPSVVTSEVTATAGQGHLLTSVPDSGSVTAASTPLGRRTTTGYALSNTQFAFTWDQLGVGTGRVNVYFTTDADVEYALDGVYSGTQVVVLNQLAGLFDVTLGTTLFENRQVSLNTANESFTLGEQGGNASNYLAGSLTGILIAGHLYQFAGTGQLDGANATASGTMRLVFLPEPGTAALVATGLFGLARHGRRRSRHLR